MTHRTIVVGPLFEDVWPLAADSLHELWRSRGPVEFNRCDETPSTLCAVLENLGDVTHLVALGIPVTESCVARLDNLEEAFVMSDSMYEVDSTVHDWLNDQEVQTHDHTNEGFWGNSVAEFGIALTINALRKIPQKSREMIDDHNPWDLELLDNEVPGARGHQFADDPNFVNGTISGKRVRIVGLGNIGSRYASTTSHLGAEVAAHDPYANEPCFTLTEARRVKDLDAIVDDAEIFVPTVPLTDATRGLITREHIEALPEGCVVVLITRSGVCDFDAIRERVLSDEIALAADVWDKEPLSLDDPLLGRHNVVHTPHLAGRTQDANEEWAESLNAHFS